MALRLYTREELIDKFGWEEYVVFALMLGVSAAIGIYFWWRGQKNNAEFLMGGRSMGTLPMSMSLLARYHPPNVSLLFNRFLRYLRKNRKIKIKTRILKRMGTFIFL